MRLFLKVNGLDLRARPEEKYNIIIRAAGSDAMEVELAQRIASNLIDLT